LMQMLVRRKVKWMTTKVVLKGERQEVAAVVLVVEVTVEERDEAEKEEDAEKEGVAERVGIEQVVEKDAEKEE